MSKKFVKTKEAVNILGIHYQTLHKLSDEGKIETIRNQNGYRMYNVEKYIQDNTNKTNTAEKPVEKARRQICYCRVSTLGQRKDLERQVEYMKAKYPTYEIIKDIGSGINFKRKGLVKVIKYAIEGEIDEIVVAHKDRLCRIGYEMIEYIINEYSKGKVTVLNQTKESPEEEVVNDLVQIINVFSARVNGLRKYKTEIKKIVEKEDENDKNMEKPL